jgi:hypothetical protein
MAAGLVSGFGSASMVTIEDIEKRREMLAPLVEALIAQTDGWEIRMPGKEEVARLAAIAERPPLPVEWSYVGEQFVRLSSAAQAFLKRDADPVRCRDGLAMAWERLDIALESRRGG